MILNVEQQQAVEDGQPVALNVSGTECILVRKDVYLQRELEFNSNPWTTEEMNLLADEAEAIISQKERHER